MTIHDAWVLGAYAVATLGGTPVILLILRLLVRERDREAIRAFQGRGLAQGGAVIGGLERILILTFVLAQQYGAIGLVLAAKGLIRYGEIKESQSQKVAEYVLIGTMLSIIWAMVVGLAFLRFAPAP